MYQIPWKQSEVGRLFAPMATIEVGELHVDDVRDGRGRASEGRDVFLADVSVRQRGKSVSGTLRVGDESLKMLTPHGTEVPSRIVALLAEHALRPGFSFAVQAVANSPELLMLEDLGRDVPLPKRV